MHSALRGWELRWQDAISRAESSVAAREASEGLAPQALENQRRELQRWLSEHADR